MKFIVKTKSGKQMGQYEFDKNDKVGELKKRFNREQHVDINRQRFTYVIRNCEKGKDGKFRDKKIALKDETKTFSDYDLNNNNATYHIVFKDLGPQIGWKTVFLVEYFGPILVHTINYFLPQLFYGKNYSHSQKSLTQQISFYLILIHYTKRELETLFVHRFSSSTMPLLNIFKNSTHYLIFGGIIISYFLYHPKYIAPFEGNNNLIYFCGIMMLISEFGNLHAHITLKNLRSHGTKERGIPKGQLFGLVSCANYTWELSAWFWFAILTSCLTSWLFLLLSFAPMYSWALKKHKRYKKEFLNYPRNRKAIIPFIV